MSISRVFLDIEDVFEVELERKDGQLVVWYWHGSDRDLGHIALHGNPDVFVKDADGRRDIEDAEVEVEAEEVPKTGPETRARVIELLSNTRDGYTVDQLVTFVPNITTRSSMWTVLHDLRKTGVEIKKGPSPYGGRARAFWIA